MISGMTVYYRLSEENVNEVFFTRRKVGVPQFSTGDVVDGVLSHIAHGAPVEVGMICPAEVFKPYSLYEHCAENELVLPDGMSLAEGRQSFSGFADLRVSLPGNDTLWVPRAEWDQYPTAAEVFFGVGTNVVPEVGKFTVVQPAPLLY